MSRSIFGAILMSLCLPSQARAFEFNGFARVDTMGLRKLRYVKPVLLDVLYRAGGPGGARPLPAEALDSLCRSGFSSAIYLYADSGMSASQISRCRQDRGTDGQVTYMVHSFREQRAIMTEIRDVIMERRGPVLVHCWNGWHASGEVAANALVQFCGWSGDQAAAYWAETIGDPNNLGKYGSVLKRIRNFRSFEDLKIPADDQDRICPRGP